MSSFQPSGIPLDYGYAETGERTRLLTKFFHTVYLYMAIGLVWTAIVSFACVNVPALRVMLSPGLLIAASLGAFVVSIATNRIALRSSVGVGLAMYILYATLIGIAIAPIWAVYRQATIGVAFGLTGGIFAVMSLIGFVTKIDLSKLGSVLTMIVIGLFIGSIVNIFFASNTFSWFVTYAVVIIFPVLVTVETKQLKEFAIEHAQNGQLAGRIAVVGAMSLYIAFINIFISLLRILGDRR